LQKSSEYTKILNIVTSQEPQMLTKECFGKSLNKAKVAMDCLKKKTVFEMEWDNMFDNDKTFLVDKEILKIFDPSWPELFVQKHYEYITDVYDIENDEIAIMFNDVSDHMKDLLSEDVYENPYGNMKKKLLDDIYKMREIEEEAELLKIADEFGDDVYDIAAEVSAIDEAMFENVAEFVDSIVIETANAKMLDDIAKDFLPLEDVFKSIDDDIDDIDDGALDVDSDMRQLVYTPPNPPRPPIFKPKVPPKKLLKIEIAKQIAKQPVQVKMRKSYACKTCSETGHNSATCSKKVKSCVF
jgi:hypothetical protein